ncbi:hypothetical protein Ssi03_66900 [Sphaerisporangium siamense]|uniref:Uncharacterized protein n=1 Tax=Sphaerisporangium siamense TaxID=795645 RepID=A0A7W7GDB8_9ACTN|nr:hypothetical protein [Sphaerisporangium siamense]GII88700.1 hypothetical protein Ssi03_66900 [Sphaerisporangium siamense]
MGGVSRPNVTGFGRRRDGTATTGQNTWGQFFRNITERRLETPRIIVSVYRMKKNDKAPAIPPRVGYHTLMEARWE